MKHVSEEEMIEHYYSEDSLRTDTKIHLQACQQCAGAYEDLCKLLGSVHVPDAPLRDSEYGGRVWQSIERSLRPYEPKRKRHFYWPQFAFAAACALFLACAFFAGRIWEHTHPKPLVAGNEQQTKERVVLFVLDNHLDRSERLLVQLNHAQLNHVQLNHIQPNHATGDGDYAGFPLQTEAQQLLSDNRLYRQSASRTNDPLLNAALDHLERVLLEVANSGGELSEKDLAGIQKEMNTEGLLFQIRVLRAKVSEQTTNVPATQKGANI